MIASYIMYLCTYSQNFPSVRGPQRQVHRREIRRGAVQDLGVRPEHAHHCRVYPRDCLKDLRWTHQIPPSLVPVQGKESLNLYCFLVVCVLYCVCFIATSCLEI